MTATFAPFGLRFVGNLNGSHGNEQRQYYLPNGATCPQINRGAPVKMSGGVITSVGAAGQAPILGVAAGFYWVDSVTKRPIQQNYIPAGTSSGGLVDGFNQPLAFVVDAPDSLFFVQADASVSLGDMGLNFDVTAVGGDTDTIYGTSKYALKASSRSSAITGAFKIVGLARIDGNTWSDAFPIVTVKMNRSILAEASAT